MECTFSTKLMKNKHISAVEAFLTRALFLANLPSCVEFAIIMILFFHSKRRVHIQFFATPPEHFHGKESNPPLALLRQQGTGESRLKKLRPNIILLEQKAVGEK